MCLRAREDFCKLFLITAGTTPNFGHGLRVGTDIWKKIFSTRNCTSSPRAGRLAGATAGCAEDGRRPKPWANRGTKFLPRLCGQIIGERDCGWLSNIQCGEVFLRGRKIGKSAQDISVGFNCWLYLTVLRLKG